MSSIVAGPASSVLTSAPLRLATIATISSRFLHAASPVLLSCTGLPLAASHRLSGDSFLPCFQARHHCLRFPCSPCHHSRVSFVVASNPGSRLFIVVSSSCALQIVIPLAIYLAVSCFGYKCFVDHARSFL